MSNAIFETIYHRRSIGNLACPAPSIDEINSVLSLALSAPDHKKLTPWRFVVLNESGEGKQRLGQALLKASTLNACEIGVILDDKSAQKLLAMPKRAPLIVVCITDYKTHEKVPQFEQLLSMGAAIQNILLGFESLGYHSVWRTGPLANAKAVRTLYGITGDNVLAGFVYVGSSSVVMPERTLPNIADFVQYQ